MADGVQDMPTPDEPVPQHEASPGQAAFFFDPAASDSGALLRALGEHSRVIAELVVAAREVVPVALESVTGQGAEIVAATAGLTDLESLVDQLANVDYFGFELQVALSETEVLPAGLLVPAHSAGALFGLDGASKPPRSGDADARRESRISERLREFLDLLSLTLFTDSLAGTEVTLADPHRGRAESTLALAQDLAQDVAPARVDVVVSLESGVTARVTLILPLSLLVRLAAPPPRTAIGSDPRAPESPAPPAHPERGTSLPPVEASGGLASPIEILMDNTLRVSVELGGSSLTVEEILALGPGSVVELNRLAAEPLDILVNDRLIARGEVMVVDEKFRVRITEISSPRQRVNAIER